MKNPEPGEKVRYTGGLFPELEQETYTIVLIFPDSNGNDIEVFGIKTGRLRRKSRCDFEKI